MQAQLPGFSTPNIVCLSRANLIRLPIRTAFYALEHTPPQEWLNTGLRALTTRLPARVLEPMCAGLGLLGSVPVLKRAADLSISLNHHLFDTLYHAVALEEGATLVTADAVYFGKAKDLGGIQRLADFVI